MVADIAQRFVREPSADSVREYETRVYTLAAICVVLFLSAIAGLIVLAVRGKYFITLTQRSNVETLTLAFFLIFFGYVALLSWRGIVGAARQAYFELRAATTRDRRALERMWQKALGPPAREKTVALNVVLEREVSFSLKDSQTGRTYVEDTAVELDKGETVTVMAEISAPPATYELAVDTRYPP